MAISRGKQFEEIVRKAFLRVPNTSVDRLHDQTTGYLGSTNICDFIVYHKPYEFYIECKTIHGNTFPLNNITDNQWKGLLEKSEIDGVIAGILCWWVDRDTTRFMPIEELDRIKQLGKKSIRYDNKDIVDVVITGKKKRIFYEYDMEKFIKEITTYDL